MRASELTSQLDGFELAFRHSELSIAGSSESAASGGVRVLLRAVQRPADQPTQQAAQRMSSLCLPFCCCLHTHHSPTYLPATFLPCTSIEMRNVLGWKKNWLPSARVCSGVGAVGCAASGGLLAAWDLQCGGRPRLLWAGAEVVAAAEGGWAAAAAELLKGPEPGEHMLAAATSATRPDMHTK